LGVVSSVHFHRLLAVCWPSVQSRLACTFAKCLFADFFDIFFTHRLSSKPFLICLLTTPPHLKYVATLPCNLSLMARFADIKVSRGRVATYTRCGGIFDIRLTANLPGNLPVFRTDRIMVMSLWLRFLAHPVGTIRRC